MGWWRWGENQFSVLGSQLNLLRLDPVELLDTSYQLLATSYISSALCFHCSICFWIFSMSLR